MRILIIYLLTIISLPQVCWASRFHLLNSKYFKSTGITQGIYYDEVEKRIINKSFKLEGDKKVFFKFPVDVSTLDLKNELQNSVGIIDVSKHKSKSIKKLKDVKRFLKKYGVIIDNKILNYFNNFKPYKSIIKNKKSALYFDPKDGRIVAMLFLSREPLKALTFLNEAGKKEKLKVFKFNSLYDFLKGNKKNRFISKIKQFGFSNDEINNAIKVIESNLKEKEKNFVTFSTYVDSKKKYRYLTKIDYINNIIYVYKYRNKKNKLISIRKYDLNNRRDKKVLKQVSSRVGFLSNDDYDSLFYFQTGLCDQFGILDQIVRLSDFDPLLEVLNNEVTSSSLSQRAIIDHSRIKLFAEIDGIKRQIEITTNKKDITDIKVDPLNDLLLEKHRLNGESVFYLKDKTGNIKYFFDFNLKSKKKAELKVYINKNNRRSPEKEDLILNIYPVKLSKLKPVKIGKRIVVGSPLSLPLYNLNIEEGEKDITSTHFYNSFKDDVRKRYVKKEISAAANEILLNKTSEYWGLFNESEVELMVEQTTANIQKSTNNFKINDVNQLEAVAYKESYLLFSKHLLNKILKKGLAEFSDEERKQIITNAQKDFVKCLNRAEEKSNPREMEKCLDVFSREGNLRIGREILKIKLKKEGFDNKYLTKQVDKNYTKCMLRNDISKADKKDLELKSQEIIQGCLIQGVILSVRELSNEKAYEVLHKISKREGVDFKLSQDTKYELSAGIVTCFKQKKYLKDGVFDIDENFELTKTKSVDKFLNDLLECSNPIKISAGADVVFQLLNIKLREKVKGIKKLDITSLMNKTYFKCIQIQVKNNVKEINPELCTEIVSLESVKMVTFKSIENEVGEDSTASLNVAKKCFERESKRLFKLISKNKRSIEKSKKLTTKCVKKATIQVLKLKTGKLIEDNVNTGKDPIFLKLTIKANEKLGDMLSKCFKLELDKEESYFSIGENIDKITNLCTSKLFSSDLFANSVVKKIISDNLTLKLISTKLTFSEKTEMQHSIYFLSKKLKLEFQDFTSKANTISEYKTLAEQFKAVAAVTTAKYIIADNTKKVMSNLNFLDDLSKEKKESKLEDFAKYINIQIFERAKFAKKLIESSGNDKKLEKVTDQIKRRAFREIAILNIYEQAKDRFRASQIRTDFSNYGQMVIAKCEKENKDLSGDEYILKCSKVIESAMTMSAFKQYFFDSGHSMWDWITKIGVLN